MKGKIIFLLLVITGGAVPGQPSPDDNYLSWSSIRRLTVDDFGIKTKNLETKTSSAQFSINYRAGGQDTLAKNYFNKQVRNCVIKSASSIDTSYNTAASLRYQQDLFDICEIYTRKFRKGLKENGVSYPGHDLIDRFNTRAVTDFSNRRVEYDRDTQFGASDEKQKQWEFIIQLELNDLKVFADE